MMTFQEYKDRERLFQIPMTLTDTFFDQYFDPSQEQYKPLIKQLVKASMCLGATLGVPTNPLEQIENDGTESYGEKIAEAFFDIAYLDDLRFIPHAFSSLS